MSGPPSISYIVDPNTNPSRWPPSELASKTIEIYKIDVIFININYDSDFRFVRTGSNDNIHHPLLQVAKHVARGLYRVVSLNVSEYSCVVVMDTELKKDEMMWKNGFPWDTERDPQPDVVLK